MAHSRQVIRGAWLVSAAFKLWRVITSGRLILGIVLLSLTGASIAGCGTAPLPAGHEPGQAITSPFPIPTITPTPVAAHPTQSPSLLTIIGYGFPEKIDPAKRYLFYLHGGIIEEQGLPAISPEYGEYRYQEILQALQSHGFIVIAEQRPKDTDPLEYARRVAQQVNDLLNAGVPPDAITVIGASRGAAIATLVSNQMGNAEVNYVLLGSCHPSLLDTWVQEGILLSGNVLAIYDYADQEYAGSCQELFVLSEGKGLGRIAEIVLNVGSGHGILYQPLEEWILPAVEWADQGS